MKLLGLIGALVLGGCYSSNSEFTPSASGSNTATTDRQRDSDRQRTVDGGGQVESPMTPSQSGVDSPQLPLGPNTFKAAVDFTIPTCLHCHRIEGAPEYSTLEGLRNAVGNSEAAVRARLDETNHGIGGGTVGRPKAFLLSSQFKDAMAFAIINGVDALDNNPNFPRTTEGFFTPEERNTWASITWQTCGACHTDDVRAKGRVTAFGIRDNFTMEQIMQKASTPGHGKGGQGYNFTYPEELAVSELSSIAAFMKARRNDTTLSFAGIVQSQSDNCMGCH